MSDQLTKQDLQDGLNNQDKKLESFFDSQDKKVEIRLEAQDKKFEKLFENQDKKFEGMFESQDKFEIRFKRLINALMNKTKFEKRFDDVMEVLQTFMSHVDTRFNNLEARMDEFDRKLDALTTTLDGFAKRVEDAEIENASRDAQFARLVEWAKDVSKKTGVPLPTQLADN